jgi:hypothetical protein
LFPRTGKSGLQKDPLRLRLAAIPFGLASSPAAAATVDYSKAAVEQRIDMEGPGLESPADVVGFIGDDMPYRWRPGARFAPTGAPQMRRWVRRGAAALPALIRPLNDKQPTQFNRRKSR